MASHWVCGYCVMINGLRGSDVPNWPTIDDLEAQLDHIESVHHICVIRDDETQEQAQARFHAKYPEAGGPNCRCPACHLRRKSGFPSQLH